MCCWGGTGSSSNAPHVNLGDLQKHIKILRDQRKSFITGTFEGMEREQIQEEFDRIFNSSSVTGRRLLGKFSDTGKV